MTTANLGITGYLTKDGVHLSDKYIVSVCTKTGAVYDVLGRLHYFDKEEVSNFLDRHRISNVKEKAFIEFEQKLKI